MRYNGKGDGSDRWDADRVKALRAHLGLTQQQMAEDLGTRQQTISEWETGMYLPRGTSRTLLKLVAEGAGFEYRVTPPEIVGIPDKDAGTANGAGA